MGVNPRPGLGRPTGQPVAGIDWASEDHAVSIVDLGGVELERFTVEHTAVGLRRLPGRLQRAGVGIERLRPRSALGGRAIFAFRQLVAGGGGSGG